MVVGPLPRQRVLSTSWATCQIVTRLSIHYSNMQVLSYKYYVDLRRKTPPSQRLCNPSVEISTLNGVRKVLNCKDLGFPILFSESNDEGGIVAKYGTIIGGTSVRYLHRSSHVSTA